MAVGRELEDVNHRSDANDRVSGLLLSSTERLQFLLTVVHISGLDDVAAGMSETFGSGRNGRQSAASTGVWGMKIRSLLLISTLAISAICGGLPASAAVQTDLITFSAGGFISVFGQPTPTDPVTGSFTITFDPTLTYTDTTAGITLDSLNITLGSALSFNYDPTLNGGQLVVGGIANGTGVVQTGPPTNDFYLHIFTFETTPSFQQFGYTVAALTPSSYFYNDLTNGGFGSVTVTPVVAGVPEPSTWAMMVFGFAGLGIAGYRKAKSGWVANAAA
jgi:hypothetical protein